MKELFVSDDQNKGVSASASVLPMSIRGWFPLRLTDLIFLQSKGLSGVLSSIIVQRHQFFSTPSSLQSSSHNHTWPLGNHQFSSFAQSCPILCDPMNHSTPGPPVHHQLLEFTQTHVHWFGDAIQLSHPLLSPSPPTHNLFQHQDLFKWVSSLHQVAKVLEFQLQHQSFQWIFRADFL